MNCMSVTIEILRLRFSFLFLSFTFLFFPPPTPQSIHDQRQNRDKVNPLIRIRILLHSTRHMANLTDNAITAGIIEPIKYQV